MALAPNLPATPTYVRNPQHTDYKNSFLSNFDQEWRTNKRETDFLTNNGSVIEVRHFKTAKVVSVPTMSTTKPRIYANGNNPPMSLGDPINVDFRRYEIDTTWYNKGYYDATVSMFNNYIDAMTWLYLNIRVSINPATDSSVMGVLTGFITANSYFTSRSGGSKAIFEAFKEAHLELENRTKMAADRLWAIMTPDTYKLLKDSSDITKDNYIAQTGIVYQGSIERLDGIPVRKINKDVFGATYELILVDQSVLAFANPFISTRLFPKTPGRVGVEIDYVIMFGTFIADHQGAAIQAVRRT